MDIVNDPEPSGYSSDDRPSPGQGIEGIGFCNLRPLGLQSGCTKLQHLSFPAFITAEISTKFPGLLKGEKGGTWTARANSFFLFLFNKTLKVKLPTSQRGLLTKVQFESLGPGEFVVQEVADILMNFVCRILGGNFVSDNHRKVLSGISNPWSQYLQTNQALAKELVVFSTQHAMHLQPNSISNFHALVNDWARKVSLQTYQGSMWPVWAHDHYTTVSITRVTQAQLADVMCCRLADSISRTPALDPGLSQRFAEAFTILVPGTVFEEVEGLALPQQKGLDCLFHTVLYQASELTGIPLPEDEVECQMYAALLRFYCYLLFYRDMQDRGLPMLDLKTVFNEWMAQQCISVQAADNAGDLGLVKKPVSQRHLRSDSNSGGLLPIRSDAHKLGSLPECSRFEKVVSSANVLCGNHGMGLTKASYESSRVERAESKNNTSLLGASESKVSSRKRSSSKVEDHGGSPETVGVGLHRTASWMNGDSADGRRKLLR